MLDVTDIAEVSGLALQTVKNHVTVGTLEPAVRGGRGRGNTSKYDVMAVLGFAVAGCLRRSEMGCPQPYFRRVVDAFSAMDRGELEAKLKKGRTHFIGLHQGKPLLQGLPWRADCWEWPDVKTMYRLIVELDGRKNGDG